MHVLQEIQIGGSEYLLTDESYERIPVVRHVLEQSADSQSVGQLYIESCHNGVRCPVKDEKSAQKLVTCHDKSDRMITGHLLRGIKHVFLTDTCYYQDLVEISVSARRPNTVGISLENSCTCDRAAGWYIRVGAAGRMLWKILCGKTSHTMVSSLQNAVQLFSRQLPQWS